MSSNDFHHSSLNHCIIIIAADVVVEREIIIADAESAIRVHGGMARMHVLDVEVKDLRSRLWGSSTRRAAGAHHQPHRWCTWLGEFVVELLWADRFVQTRDMKLGNGMICHRLPHRPIMNTVGLTSRLHANVIS